MLPLLRWGVDDTPRFRPVEAMVDRVLGLDTGDGKYSSLSSGSITTTTESGGGAVADDARIRLLRDLVRGTSTSSSFKD